MEGVATRDSGAFQLLFQRFQKPILNYFYRQCGDGALSEDCLQEVFLRVWKAAPNWTPSARVSTWIFTIARNFWINERSRIQKRPILFDPRNAPAPPDPSVGASPEKTAQAHESAEQIQRAVESLGETSREVLELHRYHNLSYQDIAEVLDIPLGTVKSRMHAALDQLRKALPEGTDS